MKVSIPAVILGASGYVGGELLRLVAGHPTYALQVAVSDSGAGKSIGELFPHLDQALAGHTFAAHGEWLDQLETDSTLALFSAAPHASRASSTWPTAASVCSP